jgi:hypothetical protein
VTHECRACYFVSLATRALSPWRWRCLQFPISPEGPSELRFVDPSYRTDPPYDLCTARNRDGLCEQFSPRRQPPGVQS